LLSMIRRHKSSRIYCFQISAYHLEQFISDNIIHLWYLISMIYCNNNKFSPKQTSNKPSKHNLLKTTKIYSFLFVDWHGGTFVGFSWLTHAAVFTCRVRSGRLNWDSCDSLVSSDGVHLLGGQTYAVSQDGGPRAPE
jgi:hypothetical protein